MARKTLMTERTESGAQQYTSERMKDEGLKGPKYSLMKLAEEKAEAIGGAKGRAFLAFVMAADYAASAKQAQDSKSLNELFSKFEKKWAAIGRSKMKRAKK